MGQFRKKIGNKRAFAVMYHMMRKPEPLGYIFVADTTGPAAANLI